MGICSSCLGFGRRESQSDPSDASHLLHDSYQPHYGTLNADHRQSPQVDPEEIRRQRDALERLCVQTSDKLIDVTQSRLSGQSSKSNADYARLFAQHFHPSNPPTDLQSEPDDITPPSSGSTVTAEGEETWLRSILKDAESDITEWKIPKDMPPLTITFDDVLRLETNRDGKSPRL